MLARKFDEQFESSAKPIVDKYHTNRERWIDFCMFPDVVEPIRMPSLFPIPSHLCRRQQVFTITTATGNLFGLFKPLTVDPGDIPAGYRTSFSYLTTFSGDNSDNPSNVQQAGANTVYTPSLTSVQGMVHGGARLIASFIEVEYIGTLEQHSGIIECGLHMHSVNSFTDMKAVHLYDQGEMVQAPFYKKFRPMDGVRCVWFPVDDNDFQFQDYDLTAAGIGETPNAQTVTLRQPVFPQWAINLTGLQANQQIRVHICSYFETIVDEAYRDIFMVSRAKATESLPAVKAAVNAAVQAGMTSGPAKGSTAWSGFISDARNLIDNIKSAYGVVSEFLPAATQIASGVIGGAMKGGPLGAVTGGLGAAYNYLGN